MNDEVKTALGGIKNAWKNMLAAKDKNTFDLWSKEQKRLDAILYGEKRKLYLHFRNTSDEFRASRRLHKEDSRKLGRPQKYTTLTEKQIRTQQYQHEYYLRVTKLKRAEGKKNDNPNTNRR